jgi:hypothetical protein
MLDEWRVLDRTFEEATVMAGRFGPLLTFRSPGFDEWSFEISQVQLAEAHEESIVALGAHSASRPAMDRRSGPCGN